jgi:mannose-6-phosphate isomerase
MQRVWGGRELNSVFGRSLPPDQLIGESWELVDRADAQSVVNKGPLKGWSLHQLWMERRQEIFGHGFLQPAFPILIKILDAAEALSVQVHPPTRVAEILNGNPKTEVCYVVAAKENASIYAGLKKGTTKADFERAMQEGDVAATMHRIETRTDSFIFIPSGRIHAIDAGNVIFEIQQNSDTTYRVFDWNRVGLDGQPRELHIKESLQSIDFEDFEPGLGALKGETVVSCSHFQVERWELREKPRRANTQEKFAVFQVVKGQINCAERTFGIGDLFLVPAHNADQEIKALGESATVLRTTATSMLQEL